MPAIIVCGGRGAEQHTWRAAAASVGEGQRTAAAPPHNPVRASLSTQGMHGMRAQGPSRMGQANSESRLFRTCGVPCAGDLLRADQGSELLLGDLACRYRWAGGAEHATPSQLSLRARGSSGRLEKAKRSACPIAARPNTPRHSPCCRRSRPKPWIERVRTCRGRPRTAGVLGAAGVLALLRAFRGIHSIDADLSAGHLGAIQGAGGGLARRLGVHLEARRQSGQVVTGELRSEGWLGRPAGRTVSSMQRR